LTADALVAEVAEVLSSPGYRERAAAARTGADSVADPVRVCHEALGASA
jgi:hypothetical protein